MTENYDVNELTIRFIKEDEDRVRGSVKAIAASSEKISYVRRYDTFPKKWKDLLIVWLALSTRSNAGR